MIRDVKKETPRAFLWIPPDCKQVRGVVFGHYNMQEIATATRRAGRMERSSGYGAMEITGCTSARKDNGTSAR